MRFCFTDRIRFSLLVCLENWPKCSVNSVLGAIQVKYHWSHLQYRMSLLFLKFSIYWTANHGANLDLARFLSDVSWKPLSWLNKDPRIGDCLCCEMLFLTSLKTNVPCWSPQSNQNTSFPVAVCKGVISKYRWEDDWNNRFKHVRTAQHKTAIVFPKMRKIHSFGFVETNADAEFERHWRACKNIYHAITPLSIYLSVLASSFSRNLRPKTLRILLGDI